MSTTMCNAQLSEASISAEIPEDPVFPFDIFELIVKILAGLTNSNRRCLNRLEIANLRLVSKFFSELCLPYLFRDVDIYMDRPLQSLQQLAIGMNETPVIADYVQNLSYYETAIPFYKIEAEEDGSLSKFLHLPRIRYLKVDGRGDQSYNVPSTSGNISKFGFRSVLDHYISAGMLTALVIRSISDIPIMTIMACPNLEALELRYCSLQGWSTPLPVEVLTKGYRLKTFNTCSAHDVSPTFLAFCPNLESIKLTKMGRFVPTRLGKFPILAPPVTSFNHVTFIESRGSVDWTYFCALGDLAGVKAFPALKRLQLEIYTSEDILHGANLIFDNVVSLEELKLVVENSVAPTLLDLKKCFTLSARTLTTITITWSLQHDQGIIFVEKLCDALQLLRGPHTNVLQNMDITLKITADANQLSGTQFEQWERLDALLMENGRITFPHLREISVLLRVSARGGGISDDKESEYQGLLKTALHRCITHPEVKVNCYVFIPLGSY